LQGNVVEGIHADIHNSTGRTAKRPEVTDEAATRHVLEA
jgi:hypothetical protein